MSSNRFRVVLFLVVSILLLNLLTACTTSPSTQSDPSIAQSSDSASSVPPPQASDNSPAPRSETTMSPQEIIDGLKSLEITVESAKRVVQDEEFKSLYPDLVNIIIKNNGTSATIKNLVIAYLAFDKGGYPIKIVGHLSFSDGDYEARGLAEDVNLEVGQKFGEGKGYALDEDCGNRIKYVLACVVSADLYNDQVWENPLYDDWSATFKDKPLPDFLR